jgi:Zn-dependent protease/predicted transcriptional regulator
MRWSFRVARLAGIDIKVHLTFFLIVGFGAFQWGSSHGARGALFGALLITLLFFCVVLHELGHSLVARCFGIQVKQIVLLPIGGVAVMDRNPEKPVHELLIALAGPLVNLLIALFLALAFGPTLLAGIDVQAVLSKAGASPTHTTLVLWLLAANLSLAVFNMIPAFPLDGGRVLRAVLAMFMGFSKATRLATGIGQFLSMALGIYALFSGLILLALVAFFIFLGAGRERIEEEARSVLNTYKVGDAYNSHALTLAPWDRVSHVIDLILTSYQPDFAVLQGSQFLGIVTRQDVLKSLATTEGDPLVSSMMERDCFQAQSEEALDDVRKRMLVESARVAAVYDRDRFLGLVSLEDIAEALLVISFVSGRRGMDLKASGTLEE